MSAEPGAPTRQGHGSARGGGPVTAVRDGALHLAARMTGRATGRGGEENGGAPRSRRFPSITRDTARPEGGGRAAGGGAPAPYRQWPLLAVWGGVLIGLLVTVLEFRAGTLIIGASLLGAAVLRWALPSVGMLAVRSRFTDILTYALLGVLISLLAMMAQPSPWITIPFLEDIVHFSIR